MADRTPTSDQADLLRASLAVASALPTQPRWLGLFDWPATHAVVAELAGLPRWRGLSICMAGSQADERDPPGGFLEPDVPIRRAPWVIPMRLVCPRA